MKRKVTKLLSLLIAMMIVIGTVPLLWAHASDLYINEFTVNAGAGASVSYSENEAYNGNRSMLVDTLSKTANTSILRQSELGVEVGANYNVELYIYPIEWNSGALWVNLNWTGGKRAYILSDGAGGIRNTAGGWSCQKITEGDKAGWYKVYTNAPITVATDPNFFICEAAAKFYVDAVKITKDGDTAPTKSFDFEKEAPKPVSTITDLTINAGPGASIGYSDEMAYSGKRSLYFDTSSQTSTSYVLKQSELGVEIGANYDVELYIYPIDWESGDSNRLWVSLNWTSGKRAFIISDGNGGIKETTSAWECTKITSGDKAGWYKIYTNAPITVATDPNFFICEAKAKFYVDGVKITKAGNTAMPIVMDFEKAYNPLKNVITEQVNDTTLSVSWRNVPDVSKIELYDVTNDCLLKDDFSVSDTFCEYTTTSFTTGIEQIYRLDVTYTDGTVKSQVTGCIPEGKGWSYDAGGWELVSGTTMKPPAMMAIDENVYRTSAPSLRIFSNEENMHQDTFIIRTKANSQLDTSKTYRLTGYFKCKNKGYVWARPLGDNGNTYRIYGDLAGTYNGYNTVSGWTAFTKDAPAASADCYVISFTIDAGVEDLWFDDISLYELDGSTPVGDDLLAGKGTFDVIALPDEVTLGKVKNGNGKSRITWAATNQEYVAVYDYSFNATTPVAFVPASIGYVDIENLVSGNTYDYVIKGVSSELRESANGVLAVLAPNAQPVIIGDYVKSENGNNVTVSIDVKNNGMGSGYKAQLILAVYDANEKLTDISFTPSTEIAQTNASAAPVTLSKTVEASSGSTVKAFLWSGFGKIMPLKEAASYSK